MVPDSEHPPFAAEPHSTVLDTGTGLSLPTRSVLAAVWVVVFLGLFFSLRLPYANISRAELAVEAPVILLELIDPYPADRKDAQAVAVQNNSGWSYFPQRFDLLFVCGLILLGAWGLGHLVLRLVRLELAASCLERTVFAWGCGLAAWSLITLLTGLAGWLSRPFYLTMIIVSVAAELVIRWQTRRSLAPATVSPTTPRLAGWRRELPGSRDLWIALLVGGPFVLAMLLGALLPSVDFDVNEYHFEGPKEYFQNGRVMFLPHNVYTSFPFGTEMLTLLAMVLRQDWYRGALAGKTVLMMFGPLTALALYAAGRRWFGSPAGLAAALIYISTPWIYRISTIAYAEGGLCFYLFATLFAVGISLEPPRSADPTSSSGSGASGRPTRWCLLAGLCAGGAMACKYPGVLSVVIPLGGALFFLVNLPLRGRCQTLLLFALGVAVTVGPWLLKNAVETGNPVYPLLYRVFDGRDWDDELNDKWKNGHKTKDYTPRELWGGVREVTAGSDWLSPLLYAFAPLSFLRRGNRAGVKALWWYVAWLFGTWWLFTHRIDRFWVPMLPVVSLLAGAGFTWLAEFVTDTSVARLLPVRAWRLLSGAVVVGTLVINLAFIVTPYCGLNSYLLDLKLAGSMASNICVPEIVHLNRTLPPCSRVLSVGDAQVFDARFPVVYNTVFDRSIFVDWFAEPQPGVSPESWPLRDPAAIRQKLNEEGITHVYVCWREILRYRSPGNYGYTEFVTPERFQELQRVGILGPAWQIPSDAQPLESINPDWQSAVATWAEGLITERGGHPGLLTYQVFPVESVPQTP